MSSSHRKRRNVRLLLTARGVRAFGDGFVSILVPVYLTGIGFSAFEVGALTTAMLLGPAMMTLGIGLIAHQLKAVRLLAAATTLMVLSGIGYAFEARDRSRTERIPSSSTDAVSHTRSAGEKPPQKSKTPEATAPPPRVTRRISRTT